MIRGPLKDTGEDGTEIGCLLTRRLQDLASRGETSVLLLAQRSFYTDRLKEIAKVMRCAKRNGLPQLNTRSAVEAVKSADPERFEGFFLGHMTPSGNAFVAELLAADIRANGLLP